LRRPAISIKTYRHLDQGGYHSAPQRLLPRALGPSTTTPTGDGDPGPSLASVTQDKFPQGVAVALIAATL
jgi:hypothetical protein